MHKKKFSSDLNENYTWRKRKTFLANYLTIISGIQIKLKKIWIFPLLNYVSKKCWPKWNNFWHFFWKNYHY
jgi:hypothetical protein